MKEDFFCLAALEVGKECPNNIKKVLNPGFFFFNNRCCLKNNKVELNDLYKQEYNLYGENIFLHSIVGMNGSGKSSLLDLIYRLINNFSYVISLVDNVKTRLRFVFNLNTNLYYVINDSLFILRCMNKELILEKDGIVILHATHQEIIKINPNEVDASKSIFYTIVTNYSMQSLIVSDYSDENSFGMIGGYSNSKSWLPPLFHKNDGYSTPIVLNPYRSPEGWIDMKKEEFLTISRLSSLLTFYEEKNKRILSEYGLKDVRFKYRMNYAVGKLGKWIRDHEFNQEIAESEGDEFIFSIKLDFFNFFIHNENYPKSYVSIISKEYGYNSYGEKERMIADSYIYLVYKTLSIASKYPLYAEFRDFVNNLKYERNLEDGDINVIKRLVGLIKIDSSHIAVKIHQVLRFLDNFNNCKSILNDAKGFSIYSYLNIIGVDSRQKSLINLKKNFPPAFFVPSIFLYKGKYHEKEKCESLPYEKLSSGEKQLLSTLSTSIYHLENLKSVKSKKIKKYKKINLIFDEIEICFHPEYQRTFVYNLISILKHLEFHNFFSINILLVTHSPFILSDILPQNLLLLNNGCSADKLIDSSPFAGNICDILGRGFFLENGFVGKYAQRTIASLVKFIKNEKIVKDWTYSKANYCINNLVGDPIVRKLLKKMLEQKGLLYEENINISNR